MKRHKSLIPLSDDHHKGLLLAQLIQKNAPQFTHLPNDVEGKIKYTKDAWENELKFHFASEENILFPFASGKNKDLDELLNIIVDEHRVIKKRISELHLNDKSIEKLDELGNILKNHIRTEERELFPMIQKFCGDEKLNELENKIESVAELQKRKSQKDN